MMEISTRDDLDIKDVSFAGLMRRRIYNILLYASKYDAFMLEEDGRIEEKVFNEYVSLNLRYPPRFTLVSSIEEAEKELSERKFELIISMPSGDISNSFEWAKSIKSFYPEIPIVVLTPFSRMVTERLAHEDLSAIDFVFSWLGNADILLAIIKLIEDRMNAEEDVGLVGVQTILYVEDSIRWYSSVVPQLYKYVFMQSRSFMTEALNEHEQMLRLRGRPKILLARSYNEAIQLYKRYRDNMLGVITDVSYPHNGQMLKKAGIRLCSEIRKEDKYIPLICMSAEKQNEDEALAVKAIFIDKLSKSMVYDLHREITGRFGFGEFIFVHPLTGIEEARIHNLKGMQDVIFSVSDESLYYHVSRNNISRWLYSRAMFSLAAYLKTICVENQESPEMSRVREVIFNAIVQYRKVKNRGVVALFQRDRFDQYSNFARIGDGSLGGKGRGLAFIDSMIKRHEPILGDSRIVIDIPKTVVLCTDIFTGFMESNELYPIALSDLPDEKILSHFLKARLPKELLADILVFLATVKRPVAIRSSSLLEDSYYQPFAGVYSTYMVPYLPESHSYMLLMVTEAIKAVYASVFYSSSKAYMAATHNVIDEEKMAIVLQEICGNTHQNRYYPSFSGLARSLNYYPIGPETTDEGIVSIALGLGKYIMDGGNSLRFSASYPENVLQTSTNELALKDTQTHFYALDLSKQDVFPSIDEGYNLLKLPVSAAEADGTLKFIASTYNPMDDMIQDGIYPGGRKLITFANILKHNAFPLAELLRRIMPLAQDEMGRSVEIEFAVNLDYSARKQHVFYLLQIRPIVDSRAVISENLDRIDPEKLLIQSNSALGHGTVSDIYDLIYVKPSLFDASKTELIRAQIDQLNKKMKAAGKHYILIGPGRWGSADPWLGIPVKWSQISEARLIIEAGLSGYRVEPSQGTHFFQNLTSFGVAYYSLNSSLNDGFYDVDYLNSFSACFESDLVRHLCFNQPLVVKTDGRKQKGVVMKPQC